MQKSINCNGTSMTPQQQLLRKHPILDIEYINGYNTEKVDNMFLKFNVYLLQYKAINKILPITPPRYEYPLFIKLYKESVFSFEINDSNFAPIKNPMIFITYIYIISVLDILFFTSSKKTINAIAKANPIINIYVENS